MDRPPQGTRVRFAPSPTGRLHVGGARTALFNWLLARHQGGTMLLRIEDTDTARSTRESETSLLRDLRWLGIDWDEGPDVGGPHGPYRQSERRAVYAQAAAQLLRAGWAYPSAEASHEDTMPEDEAPYPSSSPARPIPEFDPEAVARQVLDGTAPAIRFRLPKTPIRYDDAVRGAMEIDPQTLSDFVLLRSNGLPTYNFACVVDDAAMRITHVLRGEDHLYNTSRQVLLDDALQLERPHFVHLSLILDEDRAKLKKREGRAGTFVDEYRTRGYLPEALMNFLALLGWSPESGEDLLRPEQLVEQFDVKRVTRAAAIFDVQKLRWMAGEYLRALDVDALAESAAPFLQAAGLEASAAQRRIWATTFQRYLVSLDELPPLVQEVLHPGSPDDEARQALQGDQVSAVLHDLATRLARSRDAGPVDGAIFKQLLQESGKACGAKGKALFQPVRAALTGRGHGPDLPQLFDVMGSDEALRRLENALAGADGAPG